MFVAELPYLLFMNRAVNLSERLTAHVTHLIVCFCLVFEEPEDPSTRSFFSEIISSISDVKFSHSGRYMMTRDYLTLKIWDLHMESRPVEIYQVGLDLYR